MLHCWKSHVMAQLLYFFLFRSVVSHYAAFHMGLHCLSKNAFRSRWYERGTYQLKTSSVLEFVHSPLNWNVSKRLSGTSQPCQLSRMIIDWLIATNTCIMYQPRLTIEQLSLLIERSNDSVQGRIQDYLIGGFIFTKGVRYVNCTGLIYHRFLIFLKMENFCLKCGEGGGRMSPLNPLWIRHCCSFRLSLVYYLFV